MALRIPSAVRGAVDARATEEAAMTDGVLTLSIESSP